MNIPFSLLFEQQLMLKTLGSVAVKKVLPWHKSLSPEQISPVEITIPAPSSTLLEHYRRWCGTDEGFEQYLPFHFFSQFAMPMCLMQLADLKYPLLTIVNQGCKVEILQDMPANTPLNVTVNLLNVDEDDGRAKICQELLVKAAGDLCLKIEFHTIFIYARRKHKKVEKKEGSAERDVKAGDSECIGMWRASTCAGKQFARLTGDINPIHWSPFFAKSSPFKKMLLHGFGMFARTSEVILSHWRKQSTPKTLASIEVRYVAPLFLPSNCLSVCQIPKSDSDANSWHLALKDNNGTDLMVGEFVLKDAD